MQKNTAGQKWRVFAFDRTTNAPVTGDAANITGKISKDFGAATAITYTNPAEVEDGYYEFDLSQAETNAQDLLILPQSATANVVVLGCPARVATTPVGWGDDIVQTGDSFPRIGTNGAGLTALATQASVDVIDDFLDTEITAIKQKTDQLTFTVANQVDANALSGGGLDAAGVRAAVGLANPDLDTQLGDLPTNAELATALAAADDAVLLAINALNNLSAAQVNAELLDVLTTDAFAELGTVPAASSSLKDKITWLFMYARNKSTETATQRKLFADNGITVVGTEGVTDDGTTFTKTEVV